MTRDGRRLFTIGSAWFSREEERKGALALGQLADLAVLSDDYFSVPEDRIKAIESVLTVVNGKVVYAAGPFKQLDPPALPVMPDWSPVTRFGGAYGQPSHGGPTTGNRTMTAAGTALGLCALAHGPLGFDGLGCSCFAF
jgi:hypothetical protein